MTMILDGTNGAFLPSWTTATRPASPANGLIGYNSTTSQLDQYVGGAWASVPTASGASLTTPSFTSTIGVGSATAASTGAGVTFPATQSASSNANTLDDYEEGTWTPTDGSSAGLSFTSAEATYTKIGRFAFFEFQVVYPSTASGVDTRINGFPFNNVDNYEGKPGVCIVSGFTSGFIQQKQGQGGGYIVTASGSNVTNSQASTRTV